MTVTPEVPQSNLLRTVFQVVCEKFVQHRPICSLQISQSKAASQRSQGIYNLERVTFACAIVLLNVFSKIWKVLKNMPAKCVTQGLLKSLSALSLLRVTANCAFVVRTVSQRAVKTLKKNRQRCHDSRDCHMATLCSQNLSRLHSECRQIKGYWWILSCQDLRNNSWFPAARFLLSRSSYVIHH